jgi:WD40 repeat protein
MPPAPLLFLAFSPDGSWLASTRDPGRPARLWDLAGWRGDRPIGRLSHARDPLAFSPDGRTLAATKTHADIRLWLLSDLFGAENR